MGFVDRQNLFTVSAAVSDYNMRLILLSVIQLSGGHCINL